MKVIDFVKRMVNVWTDANAPTLGASLSYYTLFSIAPLLVIALAVAGMILGEKAASGQVAGELEHAVGPQVAGVLQEMLQGASKPASGTLAIVISVAVLLVGASGVFNELQTALDAIWSVKPKEGRGILGIIKDRFLSFTMVIGTCFLLLASLILSTALSALSRWWTPESMPGGTYLWQGINALVSFGVVAAMFAIIYKLLPDVRLAWRHVGVGAVVTALFYTLGKYLLGLYLGRSSVGSSFGAAGSLAVLLIWVYYTSQIVLFGAAFTRVWTEKGGEKPPPTPNAVPEPVPATKTNRVKISSTS